MRVKFANISGLKVNLDKTACLPIGTLSTNDIPVDLGIQHVEELKVLGTTFSNDLNSIAEKNIRKKMSIIRQEMEQWKRRNLTPIGKICIIKSLLLSKLVHFCIALPNPPIQCLKEIETMFFNFIWRGKGDKIKRTKLIQNYYGDGLKMVDVKAFNDSMKLTWLKRLVISNADWTLIAHMQLPSAAQLLTYGKEKLMLIRNQISNPFYKDMIHALIRFSKQYQPSDEEILSETIWFSDHTGFPKGIVKHWDKKGLRFICDLFCPNTGQLYTREEIREHFHIEMTFLCYERLVRKLPQSLLSSTERKVENPNIPYKIRTIMNANKFTKDAYSIFVKAWKQNNVETEQRTRNKWESEVGVYIAGTSIQLMNATPSSYFLYLHYRIITRIYPTNKLLHAMKIKSSSMCSFCQEEIENLTHVFWHCRKVKRFIREVLSHLRQQYNKELHINAANWFFLEELSNIDVLLITIIKYVIHQSRLSQGAPSLIVMIRTLKMEAEK